MIHRELLHRTIFGASSSASLVAVWEWARTLSPTAAVPAILTLSLTVWQFYLLRRREAVDASISEADRVAAAELDRDRRRRDYERAQALLDSETRRQIDRQFREPPAAPGGETPSP